MNIKIKLAKFAFVLALMSFTGVLFGADIGVFLIFSIGCLAYSYFAFCVFEKDATGGSARALFGGLVGMTIFLAIHVFFIAITLIFRNSDLRWGWQFFLTLFGVVPAMVVGSIIGWFGENESGRGDASTTSIFKKLTKIEIIKLLIIIIIPLTVGGTYLYTTGKQKMLAANPVMALSASQAIDKMMTTARDESAVIDERLIALEALGTKVVEMTPGEKSALNEQLVVLSDKINTSSLVLDMNKESDQRAKMNYQRMVVRITMLQKMLGTI